MKLDPVYKVLKKKGLDHQPTFEIELKVKDFDVIWVMERVFK